MEFKLLAFQINKESIYTKNLKKEVLYQFTQEYEFIYELNKIGSSKILVEIKNLNSYPKDLYDFESENGNCQVNITAILGKNGSGKSTLLELIYLLIYCISERKEYLIDRKTNSRFIEKDYLIEYHEQLNKRINEILEDSQMELYYKFSNDFYNISNSGKQINLKKLVNRKWVTEEFQRDKFFYTISSNYSLYGLSSKGSYFWLNGLFHKNDGYKTPLVITPWRDQGNINIITEMHLAQTRVLSNLVRESFDSNLIIDDKEIWSIDFKVIPDDIGVIGPVSIGYIYRNTKAKHNVDLIDLFRKLISSYDLEVKSKLDEVIDYLNNDFAQEISVDENSIIFNRFSYNNKQQVDRNLIRCLLAKYIISKIVKICMKYSEFQKFTTFWSEEENRIGNILLISTMSNLIQEIKRNNTHVTLKLKQAINAFLFDYLQNNDWKVGRNPERLERVIFTTSSKFLDFQKMIQESFEKSKQKGKLVSQFIPTGFFLPNIFLKSSSGEFIFSQLSSGEQQMVHSIHSIIYHILNLDSLAETEHPYIAVNLILDEIELYYHPDYQRLFIMRLLESLSKLKLKCINGINMIFSTHSPFILSDIPHRNVLKLKNGLPEPFDENAKTFGANIHEMLTDSFFLDQNLIGAFAEQKIHDCLKKMRLLELGQELSMIKINNLSEKFDAQIAKIKEDMKSLNIGKEKFIYEEEYHYEVTNRVILKTINLIGEPIVKYKLLEMYNSIIGVEDLEKEKAKRNIIELMERAGLKKEDL